MKETTGQKQKRIAKEQKLIRAGTMKPPPNVLPRHKRNSWRWTYKPWG